MLVLVALPNISQTDNHSQTVKACREKASSMISLSLVTFYTAGTRVRVTNGAGGRVEYGKEY